jgi:hypothetical protein
VGSSLLGAGSFLLTYISFISALYPARDVFTAAMAVLLVTFLVRAIYCLISTRYTRALSYITPYTIIVLIVAAAGITSKIIGYNVSDIIRLSLFSRSGCIQSAVELGHGAAFGVCVHHNDNLAITANLIVYDSRDEIVLPAEKRSPEWTKTVFGMKTPFGVPDFTLTARKMIGHFYDVDFFLRES